MSWYEIGFPDPGSREPLPHGTVVYTERDYASAVGDVRPNEDIGPQLRAEYQANVLDPQVAAFRLTNDGQVIERRRKAIADILTGIPDEGWLGPTSSVSLWLAANGFGEVPRDRRDPVLAFARSLIRASLKLGELERALIQHPALGIGNTVLLRDEQDGEEQRGVVAGILGNATLLVTCEADDQNPLRTVTIERLIRDNRQAIAPTIPPTAEYPQ